MPTVIDPSAINVDESTNQTTASQSTATGVASPTVSNDSRSLIPRHISTGDIRKDTTSNGGKTFNGLLLALQAIKDSADVFPPLKSSAAVINPPHSQGFKRNQEDWFAFAQDLTHFIVHINDGIKQSSHPTVITRLEEFTKELDVIFGDIVKLLRRNKAERFMQVKADREMLENYQNRIRDKREEFNTILLLQVSDTMKELLKSSNQEQRYANANMHDRIF
ncbi:hypothetical protein SISSUDRAFT_1032025 [Sistotremastrum suecicum HHB10207 ss-3]|uniref:Uncharacterized protein n=1 Tax=Sistotremastrum suecicum HHB10207 ss-3 TaxID=1314776 RepID=A0A166F6N4_9AGAM|nr:hypothetical protein SISSUDRAFT_1032025 [Sistotremastrum suecicum HHB10207 ss-3]